MAAPEVLILGGTAEAAELARRLAADGRFMPITSLAGLTRAPTTTAQRRGGFGGAEGLQRWLEAHRPAAVVDAMHPFAAQMATNAEAATRAAGIPLLRLQRPAWQRRPGDDWLEVPDLPAAADLLRPHRVRAFLSLGAAHLDVFADCRRPWFLIRTVDPQTARPLPRCHVVVGRGPFTMLGELGLLRRHRIDVLVARNSGAAATQAKIVAARVRRTPVIMIRRPQLPAAETVADVEGALAWLGRTEAEGRNADGRHRERGPDDRP